MMKTREEEGTIELGPILQEGRKSLKWLSGKQRGADVRSAAKVSEAEERYDRIRIVFPDETRSLTTSFVLGFFSESFKKIADKRTDGSSLKRVFFDKISIVSNIESNKASLVRDIEDGMRDYILVEGI